MAKCHKCGRNKPVCWVTLDRVNPPGPYRRRLWEAELCAECQSELAKMLAETCGGAKENPDGTVQR